ncbi:hypothetical protein C0036_12010, partial [Streptomyces sp. DJ]
MHPPPSVPGPRRGIAPRTGPPASKGAGSGQPFDRWPPLGVCLQWKGCEPSSPHPRPPPHEPAAAPARRGAAGARGGPGPGRRRAGR